MLKMHPVKSGFTQFSKGCICDNFKKLLFVCTVLDIIPTVKPPASLLQVCGPLVFKHMLFFFTHLEI